jgi:glycosyltransferase involved in cell wall biosynthesis
MKILFFASYPDLPIGYSRIANILSNYLAEVGHDIYYLGISNFNNLSYGRYIHPKIILIDALVEERKNNSDEIYGVNVICDIIEKITPDIVFLYNDVIVISRIFNNFIERKVNRNFKTILYLDLVYDFQKINLINHVNNFSDYIIVFTESWKNNLIQIGIDAEKIHILPHGFDDEKFYLVDKTIARSKFAFKSDDFIILNTNRNNYRKSIDKTVDAFIKFLKIKDFNKDIKLFLNMNLNSTSHQPGFDVLNLIQVSCLKYKVDYNTVVNNHIYRNPDDTSISDEMLNYLYNSCDIGINTCVGEGFGLCNLEHGALGKPQIVSKVGGLQDIFSNEYATLIEPVTEIYLSNGHEYHGGYLQICAVDDFVNALIKYYDDRELASQHGKTCREVLIKKFDWSSILLKLNKIINLVEIN